MQRLSLLVAALLVTGCGSVGGGSSDEARSTPRSLAAVVAQYLPQTPTAAHAVREADKVAAKVEFGPGDSILVSVREVESGANDLVRKLCQGCDITEVDDETTMHVTRGDRLPGVGLGRTSYVRISIFRDTEQIELIYEGRPIRVSGIEKRPRLYVERLQEIAQDPNLGVRTVQGFLDDGDDLDYWTD